jgi:hypothetical protein
MGAFVANFHVRSEDDEVVRQSIAEIGANQVRLATPSKGWISICEHRASTQDEEWIAEFATELSSRLRTVCVAFMVHDSDIARYWLSDRGKPVDEYNSMPDYFDEVTATEKRRVRGQADVFLRYCRPGVTSKQIETVLRSEVVFAEDTIKQLAEFLGIDPDRALDDFGHPESGGGAGGLREFADDDDDDEGGGSDFAPAGLGSMMQKMQQQFAGMFGSAQDQRTSPQSTALAQAAASGNIAEIERLVEAGTDVNAPGLLPLQPPGGASLLGGMGLEPKVALSPLMAAASRGQAAAARRLLDLGANTKEDHVLYGSALHVAAQSGSPETVRLLLGAGIPAGVKNKQGLTPRALIQAVRNQIEMTKNLAKTMPHLQQIYDQLAAKMADLPLAGWDACEEALREAEERRMT